MHVRPEPIRGATQSQRRPTLMPAPAIESSTWKGAAGKPSRANACAASGVNHSQYAVKIISMQNSASHYVFLLGMHEQERSFFELEAAQQGSTLRDPKRQFKAGLFERLALSRDHSPSGSYQSKDTRSPGRQTCSRNLTFWSSSELARRRPIPKLTSNRHSHPCRALPVRARERVTVRGAAEGVHFL